MDSSRRRVASPNLRSTVRKGGTASNGESQAGEAGAATRPSRQSNVREPVRFLERHCGSKFAFFPGEALEIFDRTGVGLAIADSAGHLLIANLTAENILSSRDGLEVTSARRLRLVRSRRFVNRELFEQDDRDFSEEPTETSVLAVPRPSGKRPLSLFVRFVEASANKPMANVPFTLVFLVDPELPPRGMDRHLRQVYEFTPAEARLATLLMQGKTLLECCAQLRIRRPTAATHLQHLFVKTQTRTQSQLVSVLFRRVGRLGYQAGAALV